MSRNRYGVGLAWAVVVAAPFLQACSGSQKAGDPGPAGTTAPSGTAPPVQLPPPASFEKPATIPNRDSVLVSFGAVSNARDYRMFAKSAAGVTVTKDAAGAETVNGATIFCAGNEQHNLAADASPRKPLTLIEVTGLSGPVEMVLEAIDTPCPFPGFIGSMHNVVGTVENGDVDMFSEAEVRQTYGSLIYNGQGDGPALSMPAPPNAPHVLASTTVTLTPLGYAGEAPAKEFFEDWTNDNDQPKWIETPYEVKAIPHDSLSTTLYQNSRWNFLYNEGAWMWTDHHGPAEPQTGFHIAGGQLRANIADQNGNFASMMMVPKQTVTIADNDYLHVTYEVDTDTTQRRYWWLGLCGSDTPGQTMQPDKQLSAGMILNPFFYLADGRNPSQALWNCLQAFTLFGGGNPTPPDNTRPESDLVVILNKANAPHGSNVVQVGDFFREIDENRKPVAAMLDDRLFTAVRTRFDAYIRRNRFVLYANGKQKVCTDFPGTPLTMADAVVLYGNVFYHSASDHSDLVQHDDTAQYHYFNNVPFIDQRHWDNMGYDQHVGAPSNFNEARCKAFTGIEPP